MGKSSIEWTEHTWNPIRGCTKVSPGCKHCYAETFAERWRGVKGHPYEQGFDLRLVPEKLSEPLKWRKPRRVFVNSMSDLFHEDVPNEYIAAVFGVMAATPQHTYQVLTKRAERMREWFRWIDTFHEPSFVDDMRPARCWAYAERYASAGGDWPGGRRQWPLPNVWIGVSVESPDYLHRLNDLMATPAAVRWVSLEPLLAGVDIAPWLVRRCRCDGAVLSDDARRAFDRDIYDCARCGHMNGGHDGPAAECTHGPPHLNWVVVGGESGPKARPFNVEWARDIVRQCREAGAACFYKQGGASNRCEHDAKGGCWDCAPADLRIREYPNANT